MNTIIVKATLKGTGIVVWFVLTPKQYVHYRYLRGFGSPAGGESIPLNLDILGKMQALLEHLE